MIIIIGLSILLPISTLALCKYTIQINMKTKIIKEKYVYTINENNNNLGYVVLGEKINNTILIYESEEETNKNIFLKHKLENDIVKESYLGFKITDEQANFDQNIKVGTYFLRGTPQDSSIVDFTSPYYAENKNIMKQAFGNNNCTENSNKFMCQNNTYYCETLKSGAVYCGSELWQCFVGNNGMSGCTQY